MWTCFSFIYLFILNSLLPSLLLSLGNSNMVMALAGNKSDLVDARKVETEASTFNSILWVWMLPTLACSKYLMVQLIMEQSWQLFLWFLFQTIDSINNQVFSHLFCSFRFSVPVSLPIIILFLPNVERSYSRENRVIATHMIDFCW